MLRERHHIHGDQLDDFNIRHPVELANAIADSARLMEIFLASIASIALLVGGIGIMNIMLVSVTERTREIGVRMALGATESDVQMQFLTEAVVMSLLGGAVGLVTGLVGSAVIAKVLQWPTAVPFTAILAAFMFSACVGIFFGAVLIWRARARRASIGGRDFSPDEKRLQVRGFNPCSFRG
jgi:ABC-type antimicrobial peptide transport system permease subunit